MKKEMEFRLIHDGENWICENDTIVAKGKDFDELDANLLKVLNISGHFSRKTEVEIFMRFDFDTIPRWLRQYQSHYFNRSVVLTVGS